MGPLRGVKVVELAGLAPGPFGCMVLADLGADVLRVTRRANHERGQIIPPAGPLDRGKHTVVLNLKEQRDREVLMVLVERADVFVEGYRPGVAERLGIGPDVLMRRNGRLIYGRMTGWGQDGPLARTAGHDINYIAVAGVLDLIGRPEQRPVPPANLIGDFAGGGMLLALGVVAALFERHHSGQGQVVDAAMVDGAALYTAFIHGMRAAGMWDQPRGLNTLDGGAPFYDTYECADGKYVAVGCVEPQFFQQMLDVLGVPDEGLPFQLDSTNWSRLRSVIGAKLKERTRDEWDAVFAGTDACVSPVLSPWEAPDYRHSHARRSFVEIGGVRQPAPAPRFSRTAAATPCAEVSDRDRVRDLLTTRWCVGEEIIDHLYG